MISKSIPLSYHNIVKKELIVTPNNSYIKKKDSFCLYQKNDTEILIPRFWYNNDIKQCDFNIKQKQKINKINIHCNNTLNKEQNSIVEGVECHLYEKYGVIISLPCGYGKTVITINIIAKLQLKALVIVHKTFLLNQWKDRINEFSNARVGILRQNIIDINNKDIVIGMLQSISMKEYNEDVFNEFDLVIVDEVHNIATKVFSKALLKLKCIYSVGLSATPNRKDGMSRVYRWFLGNDVYTITTPKKSIMIRLYIFHAKKRIIEKKLRNGKINFASLITTIAASIERNKFLIDLIPTNKNTLILSSRISQLQYLKDLFSEKYPYINSSLYIGKMKHFELQRAEESQVLFATYEMISEGFDLKKLNCLLFATPRTNIEQSVGRILRTKTDIPLVIDVCDVDSNVLIAQYNKRLLFYNNKYNIIHNNK